MAFDWFDAKEASLIGIKLADDLSKELAKSNTKNAKKPEVNRLAVLQKVFLQFDYLTQSKNLNFYKKSKLINEFRWKLAETCDDKEFVDVAVKELLVYINHKPKK